MEFGCSCMPFKSARLSKCIVLLTFMWPDHLYTLFFDCHVNVTVWFVHNIIYNKETMLLSCYLPFYLFILLESSFNLHIYAKDNFVYHDVLSKTSKK